MNLAQFKNDRYLVVTDAFSKWLEVIHLGQNTTTHIVHMEELRRFLALWDCHECWLATMGHD